MIKNKKIKLLIIILLLPFIYGGCATLGTAGGFLIDGFVGLVKLPFQIVSKIVDIVNMLPKPPPGIF